MELRHETKASLLDDDYEKDTGTPHPSILLRTTITINEDPLHPEYALLFVVNPSDVDITGILHHKYEGKADTFFIGARLVSRLSFGQFKALQIFCEFFSKKAKGFNADFESYDGIFNLTLKADKAACQSILEKDRGVTLEDYSKMIEVMLDSLTIELNHRVEANRLPECIKDMPALYLTHATGEFMQRVMAVRQCDKGTVKN